MPSQVPNFQAANRRIAITNMTKVKDIILESGMRGLGVMEIARALGFSKPTTSRWVRFLESAGIIERSSKTGHCVKYGPPGIWEAHQHVRDKTARDQAKYGRKRWEPMGDAEAWANHVPLHRRIPANEAAPLGKPGIASVWELAA